MSSREEFVDYYQLLGVEYGEEPAAIKRAYLKLAKKAHPDAGGSTEAMLQLNQAYKTLMSPEKRSAYDKVYGLYNRVTGEDLELKEDGYNIPVTEQSPDTGLEDFFVDQLYSEYYEPSKKSKWKGKFKRKK